MQKLLLFLLAVLLFPLAFSTCTKDDPSPAPPPARPPADTVFVTEILTDTLYLTDTLTVVDTVVTAGPANKLVSLTRLAMSPLFIGVPHSLFLRSTGYTQSKLSLAVASSATATADLSPLTESTFQVDARSPGILVVEVRDSTGQAVDIFSFQVKRIPDPVARVSNSQGGNMGAGEFKAQGGVGAFLDDFGFNASCQITGFELVYLASRSDPIPSLNTGARYNAKSRDLVNRAKPGDIYIFNNVRAICPGDAASRKINSMAFFIR